MQSAKRLILPVFLLVAFNCFFNAAHAFEIINAPTVDPNQKAEEIKDKSEVNFGGIRRENLYEGPGVEVPNLIDVIKEKTADKKEIQEEKAITPDEAAQIDNAQPAADEQQAQSKQKMTLDADEMEYFGDRSEIEARGHVRITTYPE